VYTFFNAHLTTVIIFLSCNTTMLLCSDLSCGFLSWAVHFSPNIIVVLVIVNDVTSEVAPKANGSEIQPEVAIPLSENAPHVEDLHTSESHVSGDQSQDASAASQRQSEPEDGARFSPDLSAGEISKPDGLSLASDAAAGEMVEGQSATAVEEDITVNNLGVVAVEQIPSEETQSKEETGSVEQALGSEEPSADKHARTDDTSSVDLSGLVSGGCHLEAVDAVEMQQQTDPTSVVAEQLTNSKQADLEEGQSYPNAGETLNLCVYVLLFYISRSVAAFMLRSGKV
jgi:hypothetical protein